MMNSYPTQRGFSLIELMIVLVIMAILTAIAIPSFQAYLIKANRSEAKIGLMSLAARMENYYNQNNTYAGATISNIGGTSSTADGKYIFSISSATLSTYSLLASAQNSQASDTLCGNLTLDQAGNEGATGTSTNPTQDCWAQ